FIHSQHLTKSYLFSFRLAIRYVIMNGTTITIAIPIKNDPIPFAIDKNPGTPPIPTDSAVTRCIVMKAPAMEEPKTAATNGYLYCKLTPNIAGSVIPSQAEIPEVPAKPFNFPLVPPASLQMLQHPGRYWTMPVLAT